jgi:hypothetical protein
MKNLLKATSYTLATALAFVLSNVSAFAADGNANNTALSGGQVIGGVALLIGVILIPTIKSARKARA